LRVGLFAAAEIRGLDADEIEIALIVRRLAKEALGRFAQHRQARGLEQANDREMVNSIRPQSRKGLPGRGNPVAYENCKGNGIHDPSIHSAAR